MAYPQTTFAATIVHDDSLIGRRRRAVSRNTLLYQLDVLKNTGRYDAFKLRWHPVYDEPPVVWPIPNHLFWDSDVAKWIEGACYFLKQQQQDLPEIDRAVRELVAMIRSAQHPDGYLNIHYTIVQPGKRFTNLRDMHELYNAGHLIEAALAYTDVYQDDLLMEPILRYVDLLSATFGPREDQVHGYPGHPEIELALLRLYHYSQDPKHLSLARYFLTERGNPEGIEGQNYFIWEMEKRGDDPAKRPAFYPEEASRCLWYHQAHAPIAAQHTIEGHSVRAMYLLTAAADLCRIETTPVTAEMKEAFRRLWNNMTQRKMYVTGGIGAIKQWEGFGQDYFLPQGTDEGGCYSETCAAIGIMMLAQRILQIDLDAKYTDIMELCLYNAVLTAMSHDGKTFTYVNQLASSDTDLSRRENWFTVACCPPNVLRLLGHIGGYIWTQRNDDSIGSAEVVVNLYVSSTLNFKIGDDEVYISQQSDWPWQGDVEFTLETTSERVGVILRIPGWAESFTIEPPCPNALFEKGYLKLPPSWVAKHKFFKFIIPMEPRWVTPHPGTGQSTLSLARGPVIYCVEDFNNPWVDDHFKSVFIDESAPVVESHVSESTTGERYVSLTLERGAYRLNLDSLCGYPSVSQSSLRSALASAPLLDSLNFTPYHFRANRGGKGHMRVGLRRWGKR